MWHVCFYWRKLAILISSVECLSCCLKLHMQWNLCIMDTIEIGFCHLQLMRHSFIVDVSVPSRYCFWLNCLLLLAGDIAVNPGPVQFPCTSYLAPVNSLCSDTFKFQSIQPSEVLSALQGLDTKKSAGPDGTTSRCKFSTVKTSLSTDSHFMVEFTPTGTF